MTAIGTPMPEGVTLAPPVEVIRSAVHCSASAVPASDCEERVGGGETCHGDLLDNFVRPQQQRLRDRQAERLGSLEVDDEFELRGLLNSSHPRALLKHLGQYQITTLCALRTPTPTRWVTIPTGQWPGG